MNLVHAAARARVADAFEKAVLMVLAEAADGATGETFVGQSTIAERCGMSLRAVVNVLGRLEVSGLISRRRRNDAHGHRTSDLITVTLGAPSASREADQDASDACRKESLSASDDNPYVHRVHSIPQYIPQYIPQIEDTSSSGLPKSKARITYPPQFECHWLAYPHVKGRSSKPASLAEWRKLPDDERDDLAKAISEFAATEQATKDGGQFVPGLERWLRKGQWRDFLSVTQATTQQGETPIWEHRVARFRQDGAWPSSWGERPDRPRCQAPSEVLARHGYGTPLLKVINGGAA